MADKTRELNMEDMEKVNGGKIIEIIGIDRRPDIDGIITGPEIEGKNKNKGPKIDSRISRPKING